MVYSESKYMHPLSPLNRSQRNTISGFTLLELLVVISIMLTLFSVGFANFRGFQERQNLKIARDQFKSDLRYTQQQALAGIKPPDCETLMGYKLVYNGGPENSLSYYIAAECTNNSDINVKSINLSAKHPSIRMSTFSHVYFNILGRGVKTDLTVTLSDISTTPPAVASIAITKGGEIN